MTTPVEMNTPETDAEIVARVQRGDGEAFEEIVRRFHRLAYSVCYRILGHAEDARDACQATFVRAYLHLASYRQELPFFSWFYRIAVNESLQQLQKRRANPVIRDECREMASEAVGTSPHRECQDGEFAAAMEKALLLMTIDHRLVVILRHFLDFSYAEMARILDIPDITVKSRLFEARQSLRTHLRRLGFDGSA